MAPLVVDPCGYLKPHHSVGHCHADLVKTPCQTCFFETRWYQLK